MGKLNFHFASKTLSKSNSSSSNRPSTLEGKPQPRIFLHKHAARNVYFAYEHSYLEVVLHKIELFKNNMSMVNVGKIHHIGRE